MRQANTKILFKKKGGKENNVSNKISNFTCFLFLRWKKQETWHHNGVQQHLTFAGQRWEQLEHVYWGLTWFLSVSLMSTGKLWSSRMLLSELQGVNVQKNEQRHKAAAERFGSGTATFSGTDYICVVAFPALEIKYFTRIIFFSTVYIKLHPSKVIRKTFFCLV